MGWRGHAGAELTPWPTLGAYRAWPMHWRSSGQPVVTGTPEVQELLMYGTGRGGDTLVGDRAGLCVGAGDGTGRASAGAVLLVPGVLGAG